MSDWRPCTNHKITGSHWVEYEKDHINILNWKDILFGLEAVLQDVKQKHVWIKLDSLIVIANSNNYGSVDKHLLSVMKEIFDWANEREIDLSA